MKHKRSLAAIWGGAVLVVGLVGCQAASPADDANVNDGAAAYKIMVIQPQSGPTGVDTTAAQAAKAAVASISEQGGFGGAEIEVISCDPASDPNKSVQCARDAVSKGVVAVVGSFDPIGAVGILPVLESASIPMIAPLATVAPEFSSSVSFPVSSGALGAAAGLGALAVQQGCSSAATWGNPDVHGPSIDSMISYLESHGIRTAFAKTTDQDTDLTPAVSQALAEDPDCLLFAGSGIQAVQIFQTARNLGSEAQIISGAGTLLPPQLAALGSTADGAILALDAPLVTDPQLQEFRSDIEEFAPEIQFPTTFSLNAWYGVNVLSRALDEMAGQASPESLLEHLGTMSDIELPGMATFSFSEQPAAGTIYPRMFNPTITYATVSEGGYTPGDGEWIGITGLLVK